MNPRAVLEGVLIMMSPVLSIAYAITPETCIFTVEKVLKVAGAEIAYIR